MEKVILGKTGISVSKVGFGVLTVGATQLNLSVSQGSELIAYGFSQGINFFDTAEYYKTYPYMAELVCANPDSVVISSKSYSASKKGMLTAVNEARAALDRDYIDIFLLHEVRGAYDFRGRSEAWECLCTLKEKGIVKAVGISTHHVDVAEMAAELKECDVLFPLINFMGLGIRKGFDAGTASDMAAAIAKCAKNGKGVYGMKAFGGGNLTGKYREALDYVYGLKGLDSLMIGFGNKKEIDDITDYLSGNLAPDYVPNISNKKIHIEAGNCEGCGTCIARCPAGAIKINKNTGLAEVDHSLCLTCGYCAPLCPVRAIIMF